MQRRQSHLATPAEHMHTNRDEDPAGMVQLVFAINVQHIVGPASCQLLNIPGLDGADETHSLTVEGLVAHWDDVGGAGAQL